MAHWSGIGGQRLGSSQGQPPGPARATRERHQGATRRATSPHLRPSVVLFEGGALNCQDGRSEAKKNPPGVNQGGFFGAAV